LDKSDRKYTNAYRLWKKLREVVREAKATETEAVVEVRWPWTRSGDSRHDASFEDCIRALKLDLLVLEFLVLDEKGVALGGHLIRRAAGQESGWSSAP
jgi:hypothetical protein